MSNLRLKLRPNVPELSTAWLNLLYSSLLLSSPISDAYEELLPGPS